MATKIVTKNSSTGGSAPSASDLVQGELAVNVTDKRLYTENNAGAIVELGTNPATEITANAGIAIPDSVGATFGAGDDLTIYHSGGHSYIQDTGTGNLYLGASALVGIGSGDLQEMYATFNDDGAVSLRHDNSIKLVTTANGIDLESDADISMGTAAEGQLHIEGNGYGFGVALNATGAHLYTNSAVRPLIFGVNETEKMRIDSSGNVLVGKSSSNLGVDGVELKNGTSYFTNTSASPLAINREGTDGQLIGFYNDLVGAGAIICSGSSVSYATSSDYRLKEDDVPMTGATERVKALRPINFAWKADGSRVDGFFAHEAQEVVPEAVHGSKDAMRDEEYEVTAAVEEVRDADDNITTEAAEAVMGTRSVPDMQGIDQSKLVPLLVAALQEAIARIETLEGA